MPPVPELVVSGALALIFGAYAVNNIRGHDHGADQKQHPDSKKFITEDEDFWRWIAAGIIVTGGTAWLTPRVAPAVNDFIRTATSAEVLVFGVLCLFIFKAIHSRLV